MKLKIIIAFFCFNVIVVLLLFFLFQFSVDRLYYIADADLYIKIYRESSSDTVDIFFIKDRNKSNHDSSDFIRVTQSSPITVIFNKNEPQNIILPSFSKNRIFDIYSNIFKIEYSENEYTDTLFYKPMIEYGVHVLKEPYFSISISEYIENVYVSYPEDSVLTRIDEVRR